MASVRRRLAPDVHRMCKWHALRSGRHTGSQGYPQVATTGYSAMHPWRLCRQGAPLTRRGGCLGSAGRRRPCRLRCQVFGHPHAQAGQQHLGCQGAQQRHIALQREPRRTARVSGLLAEAGRASLDQHRQLACVQASRAGPLQPSLPVTTRAAAAAQACLQEPSPELGFGCAGQAGDEKWLAGAARHLHSSLQLLHAEQTLRVDAGCRGGAIGQSCRAAGGVPQEAQGPRLLRG